MSLSDKIRAILSGLLRPYRGVPPQLQNKAARQDCTDPDDGTDGGEEALIKSVRPKRFGPEVLPANPSSIFIRRPVATTLLTIALALAGAVAFRLLPIAPLPEMDFPVIFVKANLPGAGPESMAATVSTPLERALGHIAGVNEITSRSSLGSAQVIMQFEASRDINGAARDVQAAINAARSTLPTMPSNPTYRKVNPSGAPILILRLTSDTVPNYEMYDAAESVLSQKISQIEGVGEVNIGGAELPAIRVDVIPDALTRVGLTMSDVSSCIKSANSFIPHGFVGNHHHYWIIGNNDQLKTPTVPNYEMYDAAESVLSQKISQIEGVGEVNIGGAELPAIRVDVIPDALTRVGLTMSDVSSCIKSANSFIPHGFVGNHHHYWIIGNNDQLKTPEEYADLILTYRDGAAVRLGDVAKVSKGPQSTRAIALADGKPAILLMVFKSPGANVISTVDRVKALIPSMKQWLPEDVHLDVGMDKSITIRASLGEVEKSLLLSMALVILVVFLFLRNTRATSIPAVAAPVSLIGTFAVMYVCGYTLDNLSLMALTIATGFVVDDAIVVLENIVRRLELGETPLRASLRGSREVCFTVVSMSLSLVAIFIPILCMPGTLGSLFREFAVVLSVAVLISMAVSLTTTPMMCASLLRGKAEVSLERETRAFSGKTGFIGFIERLFGGIGLRWGHMLDSLRDAYVRSLNVVLRHRRLTMFVFVLVLAGNVWLYIVIPKGFFPQQDTGMIMGGIRMDQSLSFQASERKLRHIQSIIRNDPAVSKVSSHMAGGRGSSGIFITLKPLDERGVSAQQVIDRLRPKLLSVPGAQIFLQPDQDLRMGGRSSRSQYQYTLQGDSISDLRVWGQKLKDALSKNSVLTDVDSDLEERGLETMLTANRDLMSRYGVTMKEFDNALGLAFGETQADTIYHARNQYKVVLEYDSPWLQAPESLEKVHLPGRDGLVPLKSVADIGPGFSALSVNHQGQFAAVTISFNLAKGHSLSEAQTIIEDTCASLGIPENIFGSFQGNAKLFADTIKTEAILILAAIIALYIVLGVLYESLIHPLTILSTLPPAGGGALIALMLCGKEFSVIALIGVLLLCGLVKKNAILVIDFALTAERMEHKTSLEAISEACRLRFRPIMMTTFAAMFGAVPLALGQGDGAELRQPLGIAIVGGLAVSQLLTLYTTPVIFLWLDGISKRFSGALLRRRYGARRAGLILAIREGMKA